MLHSLQVRIPPSCQQNHAKPTVHKISSLNPILTYAALPAKLFSSQVSDATVGRQVIEGDRKLEPEANARQLGNPNGKFDRQTLILHPRSSSIFSTCRRNTLKTALSRARHSLCHSCWAILLFQYALWVRILKTQANTGIPKNAFAAVQTIAHFEVHESCKELRIKN